MKVLFISHFFPPTHTAGAENYTCGISSELASRGHDIHVLCAGKWSEGEDHWNGFSDQSYRGVSVKRVHLNWTRAADPNRSLYFDRRSLDFLRRYLNQIKPDLVHITSLYTLSASVISAVKEANLPLVATLVDFWFICPSVQLLRSDGALCNAETTPWECLRCMMSEQKAYRWPARLLGDWILRPALTAMSERPALNRQRGLRGLALDMKDRKRCLAEQLRKVDLVLAPSRFLGDRHAAIIEGLSPHFHPYGHDLSWVTRLDRREVKGQVRFCFMGQIAPVKGLHILLDAMDTLRDLPQISLDIWGRVDESSYGHEIRRRVAQDDRVQLRGVFARPDLAEVLSAADSVVVPSVWYENNPLVIQEAFAARIPVVATDLPGLSESVTEGVNGLLFRRDDSNDLARQLRRLATAPGLLQELEKGIPDVKSVQQEADELLALYQVLASRSGDSLQVSQEMCIK